MFQLKYTTYTHSEYNCGDEEIMANIRKQPYRIPEPLVPEELANLTHPCSNCGHVSQISWHLKQKFPKQPIAPDDGADLGCWVPVSFQVPCRGCGKEIAVDVPLKETKSNWTLYGDEAGRLNMSGPSGADKTHFFCMTLVGLHNRMHKRVQSQINKLKKKVRPHLDPANWHLHFTEIWDNKDINEYQLPTKASKIEFAKELARIIRSARSDFFILNVSSCVPLQTDKKTRAATMKKQKQDVFCFSLLSSLQQCRQRELGIRWVFDNIQDTTKGTKTEGWAEEVFLGLQYIPLFTYLSSGSTVLKPEFVKPGSHYLLEIADFISFCVARDFHLFTKGDKPEFSSSLLGNRFYQAFLRDGSIDFKWSRGLPIRKFYARR